jgi:hypothetical protein
VSSHVNDLLALDGDAFVRAAYRTLLGRQPDPGGLGNYVQELNAGVPKLAIVSKLRNSDEGRRHRAVLKGYRGAQIRQWLRPRSAGISRVSPGASHPPSDDGVWLDVLGILDGVDKASLRGEIHCSWDYLRHYAPALREYRDQAINVLEIGVAAGASLTMWLRFFSKATVVGVDIDPACAALSKGRAVVKIGSQDDRVFMTGVAEAYPPSIVIDDGSHLATHIIRSFEALFPLLLSGGTYIVEDLVFHFACKGGDVVAVQPFKDQPDDRVFDYFSRLLAAKAAHVTQINGAGEELNRIYASIDSICVVGGALIIKKRALRDLSKYVAVFEDELRTRVASEPSRYDYFVTRYAEFLIIYQYHIQRAVQLLEELLIRQPHNAIAQGLLHKALVSSGKSGSAGVEQDVSVPATYLPEQMVYPHR